jgi:hypothetical protein
VRKKATTDKGLEVVLSFEKESEVDERGWVVHEVDAFVGEEQVGYLKISYIPSARFEELLATPLDWAMRYGNRYGTTERLLEEKSERDWDIADYRKVVKDTYDSSWISYEIQEKIDALSLEELKAAFEENKKKLNRRYRVEHAGAKAHHVDKPMIDFIRVFDEYENSRPEQYHGNDWRRKGIATLLYEAGAIWMSQEGLMLYASGLQEPAAAAAWKKLEQKHEVTKQYSKYYKKGKSPRRYLDGSKIDLILEDLAPTLDDINVARSLEETEMPKMQSLEQTLELERS